MTEYSIYRVPFTETDWKIHVPDDAIFAGLIEDEKLVEHYGDVLIGRKRYLVFLIPISSSDKEKAKNE